MEALLKDFQITKTERHHRINTEFNGKDIDTQKQSDSSLLSDFEKIRQEHNSRDAALIKGICGICLTCDPLHCLLVNLFD